jgi:RNA polymerase sigma-70 factor (ECF subfamily)
MQTVQSPLLPTRTRSLSAGSSVEPALLRSDPGSPVSEVGALLLRVGHGDAQAFDELYERTAHRVYGLVRRILIDAEMSAETTQDVFLALWVGDAARFDPVQGSGMSWMMTIAHRRAVDKVRAEQSHRVRDSRWGLRNRDTDYDQVADAVIEGSEADAVRSGLRTLSKVQREAIHLAYYSCMTYVQVADHLGVPVPTVKTRIRDGIKRLGSCLQEPA